VLLRNFLPHSSSSSTGDAGTDCTGGGGGGDGEQQEQGQRLWPWPALRRWRREALLETHGSLTVPIRRSSQIKAEYVAVQYDGTGPCARTVLCHARVGSALWLRPVVCCYRNGVTVTITSALSLLLLLTTMVVVVLMRPQVRARQRDAALCE
jgi:hypothetical protein